MKYLWVISMALVLSLSSLHGETKTGANCFTLCHSKIKKLCPKSSFSLEGCLKACNTWTDQIIQCMDTATRCEQINLSEGSCRTEDTKDPYEKEKEKPIKYGCSKACYNYKKCVSYADDDTQADRDAAYNTCFKECQNWSTKTIRCMSSVHVTSPMHCVKVTQCGLLEYTGTNPLK